jgi:hypothetical protein
MRELAFAIAFDDEHFTSATRSIGSIQAEKLLPGIRKFENQSHGERLQRPAG